MMTKQRQRSEEKRRQIVDTARDLFWRHGIRRITVEEIARTAGVSKATFYKHFANKAELTRAIFDELFDEGFARFDEIEAMGASFPEKVERVIQMKLEHGRGLHQEFIKDFWQNSNPEIQRHIEARMQEGMARVQKFYAEAQERGDIRRDIKLEFIMYVSDHLRVLVTDEKLVRLYASPQEMIGELVRFYFYGIMPRE